MKVFTEFTCQDCGQKFMAPAEANAICPKCGQAELLCPACEAVHRLSAAMQDHYFAWLMRDMMN